MSVSCTSSDNIPYSSDRVHHLDCWAYDLSNWSGAIGFYRAHKCDEF